MNLDFSKISVSRVILWLVAIAIVSFFLGFVTLALTAGFPPPGELSLVKTGDSKTSAYDFIEHEGARSADVFISMGVGNLTVQGGTDKKNLMESTITTGNPEWRPEITYDINNSRGVLRIIQKERGGNMMFPATFLNTWDIRLNDEIPLALDVKMGVGDSKLNIGKLNLTALLVKMGTGEQVIDFGGYLRNGPDTEIICGVGDLTVRVPASVNSRITVENGVGDIRADGFERKDGVYTRGMYSDTETAVLNIHIKQGVGTVILEAV